MDRSGSAAWRAASAGGEAGGWWHNTAQARGQRTQGRRRRAAARPGAAQGRPAAGDDLAIAAAPKNERGNCGNVQERGEHELHCIT